MARLSVVVPLYNKAKSVRRTLESVAAQTFSAFDVIVVDDGSSDGGPDIVEAFPDPRVRLIRQANAGPGAARNRGLRESTAELVAFLDADDEWLPGYLDHAVRALDSESRPEAVACGWFDEPGRRQGPVFRDRIRSGPLRVTARDTVGQLVEWLVMFSPCSTVARRATVEKYGGFYQQGGCRYGEDAHLWLKVLLNETVYVSIEPLAIFHREDSALSSKLLEVRPLEPFFTDPGDVRGCCPAEKRPLLELFLAYRAQKTACVLGSLGQWEGARRLLREFSCPGGWRLPWFLPSRLAFLPPAGFAVAQLAAAWRDWKRARRPH